VLLDRSYGREIVGKFTKVRKGESKRSPIGGIMKGGGKKKDQETNCSTKPWWTNNGGRKGGKNRSYFDRRSKRPNNSQERGGFAIREKGLRNSLVGTGEEGRKGGT